MDNMTQTVSVGIEQINSRRWDVLAVALNVLLKDAGFDAKIEIKELEKRLDVVLYSKEKNEQI